MLQSKLEIGQLYAQTGKIDLAILHFEKASKDFLQKRDFESYFDCQNKLLEIFGESGKFDRIDEIKEEIQSLVLKEGIEFTAKTYSTLGICSIYKNNLELAMDYFQKSLALALSQDSKEEMCFGIFGLSLCYFHQNKFEDASRELYNLKVFFEVIDLPELKVKSQILNAEVLIQMNQYDQAIHYFWESYEELKKGQDIFLLVSCLFGIGLAYYKSGNQDLAKLYLQMAKRSAHPRYFQKINKRLDEMLAQLGASLEQEFDLIFHMQRNYLVERKKGKIDFNNQFILLELLHLFLKQPGKIYTKEELVQRIWNQDYNPSVHDNKVYVTIKRLRRLIEPDFNKPMYIFRAKNGYYLNKRVRVSFESSSELNL